MKYILICALMLSFLVSCGGGNAGTSGGNSGTSGDTNKNSNDKNEKTQCPKSTSDELPPQLPCKT